MRLGVIFRDVFRKGGQDLDTLERPLSVVEIQLQRDMDKEELQEYMNKPVVVDTGTPFIYIGTLSQIGNSFITLQDVDARHVDGGGAGKEKYALSAKKFGIKRNRLSTKIRIDVMTSISHLEDIIEY